MPSHHRRVSKAVYLGRWPGAVRVLAAAFVAATLVAMGGCATGPSQMTAPSPVGLASEGPVAPVVAGTPVEPLEAIRMVANITFMPARHGEVDVDPGSLVVLQEISRRIRRGYMLPTEIVLLGFVDPGGNQDAAQRASNQRVDRVRTLLELMGVDVEVVRTEAEVSTDACLAAKRSRGSGSECLRLSRHVRTTVDGTLLPQFDN